jgi:putrescine aminotransferase
VGTTTDRADAVPALRARLRHSSADFAALDAIAPLAYPRTIVRGEGAFLVDADGRRLLDSGNHLGACMIGHGRAEVAERMAEQVRTLEFASLDLGMTHPGALELAELLATLVPLDDPMFLFQNSGSEANDAALKLARAYHLRRGEPGRVKVICRSGSYHGSTFGAMSATGIPASREPFGPLVPGFVHVAQPFPGFCGLCGADGPCTLACADDVERAIETEGPETVAAFIGEPAAFRQAIKVPHPGYWPRVRETCVRHGVLVVVDEVITGFGRTGTLFGSDHWELRPDVMTLAKGVTSGYAPLGATVLARHVADAFGDRPLAHISTYAGHPVACAAALANLAILLREDLAGAAARAEPLARAALEGLRERHPSVRRVSGLGLLLSVELQVAPGTDAAASAVRLFHECYERNLIMRTAGEADAIVAYLYPPLVVTDAELEAGVAALDGALTATGL